jgi:hypothetical protein
MRTTTIRGRRHRGTALTAGALALAVLIRRATRRTAAAPPPAA